VRLINIVITDEQKTLQAETRSCQQLRSASGKISYKQIMENNNVRFFHSSAVTNFEVIFEVFFQHHKVQQIDLL